MRKKISISFFFSNSAAKKSFLLELLIKSGEIVELPGSTVIPEGIVDVNNVSLHCHSEMVKCSRFLVGTPAVT